VKLIKEGLPDRCEVCHQSDQYDQFRNFCGRCTLLVTSISVKAISSPEMTSLFWNIFSMIPKRSVAVVVILTVVLQGVILTAETIRLLAVVAYFGVLGLIIGGIVVFMITEVAKSTPPE
jgi:hypothetical protein